MQLGNGIAGLAVAAFPRPLSVLELYRVYGCDGSNHLCNCKRLECVAIYAVVDTVVCAIGDGFDGFRSILKSRSVSS